MQLDDAAHGSSCIFNFLASSITPAATATITVAEQAFTITGQPVPLLSTDTVLLNVPAAPGVALGIAYARINTTGQLVIAFVNPTAGSLTWPATIFTVTIIRN